MKKKQENFFCGRKLLGAILAIVFCMQMVVIPVYAATYREDIEAIPGWKIIMKYADAESYATTEFAYSGKASMKIENRTAYQNDVYIANSYNLPVEKGHTYHYGFAIKAKNAANANVFIDWGASGKKSLLPFGGTCDWREMGFTYTHTADTPTIDVRIMLENKGILWIDDIYFYDTQDEKKENMIENPSFEGVSTTKNPADDASGTMNAVPVEYKEDILVDGNTSDWDAIKKTEITSLREYVKEGNKSLEATIAYAYDKENFYFLIEVEDDVHVSIMDTTHWKADSVQFALCNPDENYGAGYGIVYDPETDTTQVYTSEDVSAKVSRNGTKTVYEASIPWTLRNDGIVPEMFKFNAIINDNDDDGAGRKYCLELAPGIADGKYGTFYPRLLPINTEGYNVWFDGPETVTVKNKATYPLTLINGSGVKRTFKFFSNLDGRPVSVELSPGEVQNYPVETVYDNIGPHTITLTISDGEKDVVKSVVTDVYADLTFSQRVIADQEKNLKELTGLVQECVNQNIPIEYEKINYYVIEQFIEYLKEYVAEGSYYRVYHMDKGLNDLYQETKENLNGYLSGEKEPITAPQYVSSPVKMDGKHFVATTKTVTKDGEIEERRPVFFIGTGHLAEATEDISNYSKYGFNATHIGYDGWRLMDKIDILPEWEVHTMGERQIRYYTSSDDKKSGNYALGIQSSQPKSDKWNSYNRITQVVKVEPGKTYEYGLSAKATNASGWPLFSVDEVAKSKHSFEGTHDWKDYLFQYTTGKNQTELSFSIYIDSTADEILIDDCVVRLKGTEENLLKDPGFETLPADMDSKSIEGVTDYQIFPNVVENIENNLKKCEESDISAILMLDLSNISDYLFYQDPTVNNGFEKFWNNFIKFNPTHPEMQKFHETMIRSLLPRVKDYSAINHVMLTNEPVFVSYTNQQYYLPIYQEYLREKYGDIQKLNDCWGTQYQNFAEAEMPDRVEGTGKFSDWRKFNDTIMYDYHEFLYKTFKDVAPDVNVTSKFMQPLTKYGNGRVEGGSTNLFDLTQMMDINGCDGWAYYNTDDRDVIIKMAYYDLLTSFKEVPVFNGEDHIIDDGNIADYSEEMMRFNLTDLWQGAIHGRGGSVVWLWDRHYYPSMFINPYLAGRPKLTAEMGKLTLDLNRLSNEIVKIQDEKANVAMLYSLNSMAWNPMYINTLYHAYAAAGNNGQKVHFVDETQMGTLNEYDILIIPGANAVPQNTLLAVNAYVNQGGKVLLLNQDSLKTDEYGQEHDAAIRENIMQKATFVPVVGEEKKLDAKSVHAIRNAVEQIVQEASLNTIVVKDLSTGEKLQDAEWLWTRTEDGFLINLCRYDYTDTEVEIYINGQKAENIVDLKKQTNNNSMVTLLGYTPMLLKIKNKEWTK